MCTSGVACLPVHLLQGPSTNNPTKHRGCQSLNQRHLFHVIVQSLPLTLLEGNKLLFLQLPFQIIVFHIKIAPIFYKWWGVTPGIFLYNKNFEIYPYSHYTQNHLDLKWVSDCCLKPSRSKSKNLLARNPINESLVEQHVYLQTVVSVS
jgi:hypothetical protein